MLTNRFTKLSYGLDTCIHFFFVPNPANAYENCCLVGLILGAILPVLSGVWSKLNNVRTNFRIPRVLLCL